MNLYQIKDKKIEILLHEKKDKREVQPQAKFNNLFVKNLPKDTDDEQLGGMFAQFGEIDSVHV